MPGRDSLLDTNAAIALIEGDVSLLERVDAARVYLNATVVGELRFGAESSARVERNHQRIDRLLASCPVLPITARTALTYGQLRAELRRKGRPIPVHDLWIAATAVEYGLSVVTRDTHFRELPSVQSEPW